MDHSGVFDDARWALFWSADVLRRRQVREQRLGLQQQLYNLAASGIDSGQAAAQAAAARSLSGSISADTARRASLLDYYNQGLSSGGYSVFGGALARSAGGALGGSVGGLFGGPVGRATGGLLGSWLWKN